VVPRESRTYPTYRKLNSVVVLWTVSYYFLKLSYDDFKREHHAHQDGGENNNSYHLQNTHHHLFNPMQHTVLNNHEWIEQARLYNAMLCSAMLFVLLVTTVGWNPPRVFDGCMRTQ